MYYEVWRDAEQKTHIISEMSTEYIKNCIKSIEAQCWDKLLKDGTYDKSPEKEYQVLSPEWCEWVS